MSQGADRRARDLRVYAVLCSAGTTFGIVAAVLSWRAAMPGVGVLFLVLSGLLVPISLLLSRDAQRRGTPLGGSGSGRPAPAPARGRAMAATDQVRSS